MVEVEESPGRVEASPVRSPVKSPREEEKQKKAAQVKAESKYPVKSKREDAFKLDDDTLKGFGKCQREAYEKIQASIRLKNRA